MMATAGVIGLATGKSLLGTSFYPSDLSERLSYCSDHGSPPISSASSRTLIVSKKSPNFSQNGASQNRQTHPAKALRDYVDAPSSTSDSWLRSSVPSNEDQDIDVESSTELLLLLQKSMLEKQWDLSISRTGGEKIEAPNITRTGMSARQRRTRSRRRIAHRSWTSPELLESRTRGYVRGRVSEDLLSHSEVVNLSKKIKAGLSIEEYKWKLKEKLGHEPSVKQLAMSLKIPHFELHSKMIEYSLAREKLAMSNVRLVMSIAQKYDNMGAEMPDLIQGGLIGLLRGIEKFDSSKGFRISTYVYWWIRQGVSRVLVENSKILRLPSHLHERLSSIRSAKILLEEKGVSPSIDKIAECLNMSTKKVRNATEAVSKVFSLDREAFPSLNGLPNETLHSYIADKRLENIPWHGIDEMSLKEEVRDLLLTTLNERERDIISLYYGLEEESRSWEDISRRIGLSRERVRQVGLVAMEKLKRAARRREMEAMLVKH